MLTHIFVARKIEYTILKGGAYNKKKQNKTQHNQPTKTKHQKNDGFTHNQMLYVCSGSVNVVKAKDRIHWRTLDFGVESHHFPNSAWSGTSWLGGKFFL